MLLLLFTGGTVKRQAELFFPTEFADDFPVSLQTSDRYGLIYVVTKLGLLFVYDLETATAVYRNRLVVLLYSFSAVPSSPPHLSTIMPSIPCPHAQDQPRPYLHRLGL